MVSIISALITIIFFERIQKQYRHENAEAARKRRLQIFVGSEVNVVAVGALEELKAEGWLEGVLQDEMTLLHGANWQNAYLPCVQLPGKEMIGMNLAQAHLRKANLTQVYLRNANLAQSRLYETNLQGANLIGANFRDAELVSANLQYADLSETNMMGANLYNVNLEGAVLTHANLAAANLSEANLKGAKLISTNLRGVVFSEHHL
ncbi:MAG: pentapeptide repeat-containing protein, partial [Aggregatilineales bacterium]